MKFLFEGQKFNLDESFIKEEISRLTDENTGKINKVGYFKNRENDIYIIFPKSFSNDKEFISNQLSHDKQGKAILLYKTLRRYASINQNASNEIISNIKEEHNTFLDIILSIIKFHNQHPHMYLTTKVIEKNRGKRVLWSKTIKKSNPIINKKDILYIDALKQNNKLVNEDILFTLFYSVLYSIKKKFNFAISLSEGLPILKGHQFNKLEKKALKILNTIKHNYYSDNQRRIVQLLIFYFQIEENSRSKEGSHEYLLTSSFNLLFEKIVDEIISDKESVLNLKKQIDNKELDHVYYDQSFFSKRNTIFVGDSKYYIGESIGTMDSSSKYKQYNYIKNVIDIFVLKKASKYFKKNNIILRDETFEWYELLPNFFVFSTTEKNSKLNNLNQFFWKTDEKPIEKTHFQNRIFDRDSQYIFSFKLNLDYAMKIFTQNVSSHQKKEFRHIIRESIKKFLQEKYDFYIVVDKLKFPNILNSNFKTFNGKFITTDKSDYIIVLDKELHKDSEKILKILRDHKCDLNNFKLI
ncbi:hypothetical protein CIB95_08880 [Lottiidibacillus patelloidae]|uniref:LlaJI family restriction endonuclease n=1 Tax=Lottiidibacillus patelloidae TaxID=2670334 RepID=A0A263BT47_9BACI|nr:LlaJI family restriction endonuclease [Lottiidibacillus patelloidae]OZM56875.1 hypothetical protein CIB95_08880 [Lottiidibacillus patelloidae]